MSSFWKDLGNKTKQFLQFSLAFASVLFIFWLIPKTNTISFDFEKGKPWQYKELFSPYDFAILKADEDFLAGQNEVRTNHLKHYIIQNNDSLVFSKYQKLFDARFIQLDSVEESFIEKKFIFEEGKQFIQKIYSKGLIDKKSMEDIVVVENNNVATRKPSSNFYSIAEVKKLINENNFGSDEKNNILKSIIKISITPNIIYDKELNNKLLAKKLEEVSKTNGLVKKGEKIIGKGEIVDASKFQKLESYKLKYSEQVLNNKQMNAMNIGYFLLVAIIISILTFYLFLYQTYIFKRLRQFLLIFLLINISLFLVAIFLNYSQNAIYIIPLTIVPIILRAFFKRETALYVHLAIILLAGLLVPKVFGFLFIQLVAGVVAIYGNKNVRYWSQFFKAIGLIFVAYLLSFVGISLIEGATFTSINYGIIAYLALNVFLTFLAYPLIVFFEKIFGLLSDISLVEYTDLNKPLLKRLSLEAPGTFQHSLQVANLAEAAASEIKANSLLVKVGALYHDIGKMEHRIYFIENQFPEENPHEKLSYEESAKIIIAHVTEGVKLAKKNGLPLQIIEFIKTHHGTTRVEYFYRMHAKLNADQVIDEDMFCYPGPAPFKKEHAILMMADSVEAASRSLKNPTHESLSNLVDSIIDYQKNRGQFDNVNITFAEISRCKDVFKKMLASIYHIRIEYPKD